MQTLANDKLVEWPVFAKAEFAKPPSRRVGKRLIESGEIPGRIIDGKPYVYPIAYRLTQGAQGSVDDQALALLN